MAMCVVQMTSPSVLASEEERHAKQDVCICPLLPHQLTSVAAQKGC